MKIKIFETNNNLIIYKYLYLFIITVIYIYINLFNIVTISHFFSSKNSNYLYLDFFL